MDICGDETLAGLGAAGDEHSRGGMSRKKVDGRLRAQIEGGVRAGHRTLVVVVGPRAREQVPTLHYMLSKAQVARRPTVLWCYRDELPLSSHAGKRRKQLKAAARLPSADGVDELGTFMSTSEITYAYYAETERVLGQTYGMCVLQDFEALTPNLLARTIETVQGGGIVAVLLQSVTSLRQLATIAMDAHARYRQEGGASFAPRFNERMLLSLASCAACIVVNDSLDVIPLVGPSSTSSVSKAQEICDAAGAKAELERIRADAQKEAEKPDAPPEARVLSSLLGVARTADQAKALGALAGAVTARPGASGAHRATVALTAARGRGKSAALGLAVAAAVAAGVGAVFVAAPEPENVRTLFDFAMRGLDALGLREHADYDVYRGRGAGARSPVLRLSVFRTGGRQTVQYVRPGDAALLGPAPEVLLIDEAAAVPLPQVRALLAAGASVSVVSSTVSGYEGTGRSLSLKLLAELRASKASGLRDLTLSEPIRYAPGDAVEAWLHGLLCLDAGAVIPSLAAFPAPEMCELYAVSRDTLFSGHRAAEAFLQRMMGLYVSSHYRNTPNDLQLMADAPAHRLFVLLPSVDESAASSLPDVLAVVQVALEGRIAAGTVRAALARGRRPPGDMVPWTVAHHFQDDAFGALSGARVVRVAVHPDAQGMGYGSRALALLHKYYAGELYVPGDDAPSEDEEEARLLETADQAAPDSPSDGVVLRPRAAVRPLLGRLCDRRPARLDWLGASFGLTPALLRFWRRLGYAPVYLRQNAHDATGEHTAVLLRGVGEAPWLGAFHADFCRRLRPQLASSFRGLPAALVLDMMAGAREEPPAQAAAVIAHAVSPHDLRRLEAYAANTADHYLVADMLPGLAGLHFGGVLSAALPPGDVPSLSPVQAATMVALGLQRRTPDEAAAELGLPATQLLAMLIKCVRKFARALRLVHTELAAGPARDVALSGPLNVPLDEELDAEASVAPAFTAGKSEPSASRSLADARDSDSGEEEDAAPHLTREQREMIRALDVSQYEIAGGDDWDDELSRKGASAAAGAPTMVNIRTAAPARAPGEKPLSKRLYDRLDAEMRRKARKSKYAKAAH